MLEEGLAVSIWGAARALCWGAALGDQGAAGPGGELWGGGYVSAPGPFSTSRPAGLTVPVSPPCPRLLERGPGHRVLAPAPRGCQKGNGIAMPQSTRDIQASPLRPGGVGDPAQEEQAAGAVLIDEKQERPVNAEADLGGQRHEPHGGHGRGLCALLVHRDGALVLELRRAQEAPSGGSGVLPGRGGVPGEARAQRVATALGTRCPLS